MNGPLQFVSSLVVALGVLCASASTARGDSGCESDCNREWSCRNGGPGWSCTGKVTYHRTRHSGCLAKCYLEDRAAAAYKAARETATDIGKKASQVIDKGVETVKKGAEVVKETAVAVGTKVKETAVAVGKKVVEVGRRVGGAVKGAVTRGAGAVKRGASAVGRGLKAGVDATGRGLRRVGQAVVNLGAGAKALIAEWADKVVAEAKVVYREKIAPIVADVKEMAKGFIQKTVARLRAEYPAFNEIYAVLSGEKSLADSISDNADTLVKMGKPYILKAASKAAMKLLKKPLQKAATWIVNQVLKLLDKPIATAAANALAGAIAGLAASVTAGAGATLQPILAPLLQPLTQVSATMIMDWVRKQVSERLGKEIVKRASGLIQSHLVEPLLARAYDGLWAMLQKRFPVLRGREPKEGGESDAGVATGHVGDATGGEATNARPPRGQKGKRGGRGRATQPSRRPAADAAQADASQADAGQADASQQAEGAPPDAVTPSKRGRGGSARVRAGAKRAGKPRFAGKRGQPRGRAGAHSLAKRGSRTGAVRCARACVRDNPDSGRLRFFCYRGCERQARVQVSFAPLRRCRGAYGACRKGRCGAQPGASCRPPSCRRPFMSCRFQAFRTATPEMFR